MGKLRSFGAAALLAAASLLSTAGAQAEETHLKFVTLAPPNWVMTKLFIAPWVERINEAGKGVIHVDRFDGYSIANNLNVYDRVQSDVVQIAWGIPAYAAGQFPLLGVGDLPFVVQHSEDTAVALWRMYARGDFGHEFDQVHPLMLIALPQAGLQMARAEVHTLADLKGKKIQASNRVTTATAEALGATPISLNVGEMYEALQRRTVDGVFMPWTAFDPFKLDEVTHFHLDAPLGGGVAMIFMSKKKWDALPAAAKKAIDENSGEAATRAFGKLWDSQQHDALEKLRGEKGHTIVTLPADEYARWKAKIEPVVANWEKSTPGADKVLQALRDEVAKVDAEGK
ncbi:MAG TPA: TRAP transporter substrate-binding protein [Hyphomicrobiales bacterium]|nr:TRAP transporter substrate-binding protein [Hyphomicrobiales bacterium]